MDVRFKQDEIALLAYLHEHSARYDRMANFHNEKLAHDLGCDANRIDQMASFLAGFGLMGPSAIPDAYHLTPLGENYMRHLEEAVEKEVHKKTLTYTSYKGLGEAAKDLIINTAAQVLAQVLMQG
jgi:hypothetical protein